VKALNVELHSDCSQCFALCCVLLPYSADAGFGVDKAGGTPCTNLASDDRCQIHVDLRDTGWRGCTIFECFGAGQQVSQVTYEGRSWRDPSVNRGEMAAVFSAMRLIHEMLFHLEGALEHGPHSGAVELQARLVTLREDGPDEVLAVDLDDLIEEVGEVLADISAEVRGSANPEPRKRDLTGRDLRTSQLVDSSLRGALLIAADLRGSDLGQVDLLGADLRDARIEGADLSRTLFLTQPQLNAASGDSATRIPRRLRHPWPD
jgi:uncharacterized protein YjbI with pentapeptide repeats